MRRIFQLVLVALFALLLSACEVTVTIDPFQGATEVSASTDENASRTVTLAPGEKVDFEVLLSDAVQAEQAMYFELDTADIAMTVYASSGARLASSTRSDVFFEPGTTAASSAIAPQIFEARSCRGTCAIHDADRSRFYLRLTNSTSSERTFELFLYSERYGDEHEPGNDTEAGAIDVSVSNSGTGAIEDLGDIDYWSIQSDGELFFDDAAARPESLELRLRVLGKGTIAPGSSIVVSAGDTAYAFELGGDAGDAAGPSDTSVYFVSIQ